jgi:hypothetical protein
MQMLLGRFDKARGEEREKCVWLVKVQVYDVTPLEREPKRVLHVLSAVRF